MRKSIFTLMAAALVAAFFASTSIADSSASDGAQVGQPAPQFTLQDQNGKDVSLKDFAGKIVVLEWVNPKCPYVQRHYRQHTMTQLADKYKDQDVVWLSINSSNWITNGANKEWAQSQHLGYPVLNDATGAVGKAYGAKTTPNMFIIGKNGNLLYKGAIDNDPEGDKGNSRTNYVDKALNEIISGQTVTQSETKPYGCHVAYKN